MLRSSILIAVTFAGLSALAWNAPVFEAPPTRVFASADASAAIAGPDFNSLRQIPDPATQDGLIAIVNWLIDAVHSRDWVLVVGLLLVLVVAFGRWAAPRIHNKVDEFFNSEHGKPLLVLLCAELGAVSTSLIAHQLSLRTLLDGLVMAFVSAGGYGIIKPLLQKIFSGPAPLVPPPGAVVPGGKT